MLEEPAVKKLYITYTKQLRDEAEKQFLSLVKGLDEEERFCQAADLIFNIQRLYEKLYV